MKLKIDRYPYLDSARLFSIVAHQPWAALLDSGVLPGKRPVSKFASYDVLGIKPQVKLVSRGGITTVYKGGRKQHLSADPLDVLQDCIPVVESSDEIPYLPGAIGYFSYDLARYFEDLPELAENDELLPEMAMGVYHVVVVVDHAEQQTLLIQLDGLNDVSDTVFEWQQAIREVLVNPDPGGEQAKHINRLRRLELNENLSRKEYQQRFDKVRAYTIEGDCYQVNLAKRFSARVDGDAWQTYQYLRDISPAPYGAYFNYPFAQVLSNSPESFIRNRGGVVTTSPIKGTRPRDHQDKIKDKAIAQELKNSGKDKAENLMIVDLMRNDLSRCCELGSVEVPKLFALHSFANVHHLISTITGRLRTDLHCLDMLRVCFPGGSITGAPKIRAMQIIEELEPHRRGLYCGAIGYVGVDGTLETNIAIRTIVVKDGIARYSAGGGLVIDSNADEEYQEVIDKASMMSRALSS